MTVKIKEIRKKRGIPQKTLAEDLGIAPSYLARLESGERPLTNEWVRKLTKALNCEAWELSDDEDYFFTRENLQKFFKIANTGDNSTFSNAVSSNRSSSSSSVGATETTNQYAKELLNIFESIDVKKQLDLLCYAYKLIETPDNNGGRGE